MENNEKKPLKKRSYAPGNPEKLIPNARRKSSGGNKVDEEGLTEKEKTYVEQWCMHFNGTKAAIIAGYSEKTAHSASADLLKKPHIREAIKRRRKEVADSLVVTADMITQELFGIAFADYSNIIELTEEKDPRTGKIIVVPSFKSAAAMKDPNAGRIIKSMKIGRNGKVEVAFYDKKEALEMLGKHIDYYNAHNRSSTAPAAQIYIPDNGRGDAFKESE